MLNHCHQRYETASKVKAQLEKDLAAIRREREKAHSSRTETLTKLKSDLLDVSESMSLSMRRLRDDFSNHMDKLQSDFKAREDTTLKEVHSTKQANTKLRDANALSEKDVGKDRGLVYYIIL